MSPRLATHVEVSALIRRVDAMGGAAAVLARGDRDAGSILISLTERGISKGLLERRPTLDGVSRWHCSDDMVSKTLEELTCYLTRRREYDPDLWVIELDIVGVERFAAEMTATG